MRIFNQSKPFDKKVNFVDKNNVVLGYDRSRDFCAHATWMLSATPGIQATQCEMPGSLEDWTFDPSYRHDESRKKTHTASFRIVSPTGEALYIVLRNTHNGYYAHGFKFSHNYNGIERVIREGEL
jgi:hypothetical protein